MITVLFSSVMLAYGTIAAAQYLHQCLLHCILGAPQHFFDTTPKGRVIARFSNDLNTLDFRLPLNIRQTLSTSFRVGFQQKNVSVNLISLRYM